MPLTVTLDKVSNLKNEEGHIIFDLTGTMFKINGQIFNELEGEGILLSKGKVTGRKSYYWIDILFFKYNELYNASVP